MVESRLDIATKFRDLARRLKPKRRRQQLELGDRQRALRLTPLALDEHQLITRDGRDSRQQRRQNRDRRAVVLDGYILRRPRQRWKLVYDDGG